MPGEKSLNRFSRLSRQWMMAEWHKIQMEKTIPLCIRQGPSPAQAFPVAMRLTDS
jgi:hypothetical protein